MERYQVILAYDGSHFKGFQRQVNVRSVQGVVEKALRQLGWEGSSLLAAGRTDTGVHATGQVIAFDLDWVHGPQDLQHALNAHLPADVVAREVKEVNPAFHPRYDAMWRRYNYRIYCQPVRQPLIDPYAWRVWPVADLAKLNEAARLVIGTHDFSAFGTPPHSGGHTFRCVLESGWKDEPPYLVYEVKANAFLYHMVRRLVFMQVSIAQSMQVIDDMRDALDPAEPRTNQSRVHGLAPAQGLVLAEVSYTVEALGLGEDNNETVKSENRHLDPSGSPDLPKEFGEG